MAIEFKTNYGAQVPPDITQEICACCGAHGTYGGKLRDHFPGFYVVANPDPNMNTDKLLENSNDKIVKELDFVLTKQGTIAVFSKRYV